MQGFFSRRKTNSDDFPYIGHRHNFEFYLPLLLLLYNLFKHGKIYSSYKEDNKLILMLKLVYKIAVWGARLFIKILINSFFKFSLCLKLSYFLRKAVPQ